MKSRKGMKKIIIGFIPLPVLHGLHGGLIAITFR
jgi:hypothetical protein